MQITWRLLSSRFVKNSGDENIFYCPVCDLNDTSGHFYANIRTGMYHCFKCGTKGRLPLPQKSSKLKAKRKPRLAQERKSEVSLPYGTIRMRFLTPSLYDDLLEINPDLKRFFQKKKITYEIAQKYDLGFCPTGRLKNRIILPIYFEKRVVGWQARAMYKFAKDFQGRKYQTPKSFQINHYLYNWDEAKEYPVIVVVEGPFDVFTVGPNAVATFGTSISAEQVRLLSNLKARKILMWDYDARIKAWKTAQRLPFTLDLALVPHLGPSALSSQEITSVISSAGNQNLRSLVV